MRSNDVPPSVSPALRSMPVGPRNAIDRLRSRDRIESIARLRAAVRAMGDVDVEGWDDSALTEHLEELSSTLCEIDAQQFEWLCKGVDWQRLSASTKHLAQAL